MLAYRLLLPALWLNSLFSSQEWYPSVVRLGQAFYWVSLVAASLIILRAHGRKVWPYLLLATIVASRIASLAAIPAAKPVYFGSGFMLFGAAGVMLAIVAPAILERQARTFFAWSVPLMFLQLAGVWEWLHVFNTLYAVPGLNEDIIRPDIKMVPHLFASIDDLMSTRISDFEDFFNWQIRPSGLAHSNAMLGIFIVSGAALHFGRLRGRSFTRHDLLLCAAAVLCGSKLALFGVSLVILWAYWRYESALRQRIRRIGLAVILLLASYGVLFPAAIHQNLGAGAFEVSFLLRGVDALVNLAPTAALQVPGVLDLVNTYPKVFALEKSVEGGLFSGIATLVYVLPVLLLTALLALPWILRGVSYCRATSLERARTAEFMAIAVFLAPLATPIFASQFYAFCVGVAFLPVALGFSRGLRSRLSYSATLGGLGEARRLIKSRSEAPVDKLGDAATLG